MFTVPVNFKPVVESKGKAVRQAEQQFSIADFYKARARAKTLQPRPAFNVSYTGRVTSRLR